MGPILPLPLGFVALTLIGVIVMEIIGVVAWKFMWHEDDDYVDLDKQEPFTLKDV
jgi:hypothetical protein